MLLPNMQDNDLDNEQYKAVKDKIDMDFNRYKSEWQAWVAEAMIDLRLEAGDHSLMLQMYPGMITQWQRSVVYNHARPLLMAASGNERNTRLMPLAAPDEFGDEYTADQITETIFNTWTKRNVQSKVSDAFYSGPLVTGQAWIQTFLNFDDDIVNGDIDFEICPQFSVFCDPLAREPDASDANFIMRHSLLHVADVIALYPEKKEEILASFNTNKRSMRWNFLSPSWSLNRKNLCAYDEYYYRDYRPVDVMVDQLTGEQIDVTHRTKLDIEEAIKANPRLHFEVQQRKTVRLAVLVNDEVIYDGPQPNRLDRHSLVRLVGYFSPDAPTAPLRIQSVARSMRDPALHFNRRMMLNADAMEGIASNGWIVTEESVKDYKMLLQPGPGRLIIRNKGTDISDVQPIPANPMPPENMEMQSFLMGEIHRSSGIYEEMVGLGEDKNIAALLSTLRQYAARIALQPLFDRVNDFRMKLGEITYEMIRKNYSANKVKNILNGKDPAPLFYDKSFGKYRITLQPAFDTPTARQQSLAQMVELQKELGIQFPFKFVLGQAQIQDKTKLIAEMEAQEQQKSQAAEMQNQLQMAELQAKIQLANSRAFKDASGGAETISRIHDNQAQAMERRAMSWKDMSEALLNIEKLKKEMDSIDINQIRSLLEMQQMVNGPAQEPETASYPQDQRSTLWLK